MVIWLLYDIASDKNRNKLAKACLNKGLYRVQKSVFIREVNKNQRDELALLAQDLIDLEEDSVYIFPTDRDLLKTTELIGQGFDKELIANEVITKFF